MFNLGGWHHIGRWVPVMVLPYTSNVTYPIIEIRDDVDEVREAHRELTKKFVAAGYNEATVHDNKVVFVVEIDMAPQEPHRLFIGFYDNRMTMGFGAISEWEVKPGPNNVNWEYSSKDGYKNYR